MDYREKKKSPYKGALLVCFLFLAVPCGMTAFFYLIFRSSQNFSHELTFAGARACGFAIGLVFHSMCVLTGVLKDGAAAVKARMAEFKENLSVSLRFALKNYLFDMRHDGVTFAIYSLLMLSCAGVLVQAVFELARLYLAL